MDRTWDCIVVGGGAAGLSAALVLGRARRRTLLVDAGAPSNIVSDGVGGLLGHDRRPPAELYSAGRRELEGYPTVELRSGEVSDGRRENGRFVLELSDGEREEARRVLLATGMDYTLPDLPGIAERWGSSVFHCPFCHGWEHREQALGVLDRGPMGARRALLLRAWSDDVTLYAGGPAELGDDLTEQLGRAGIAVDERRVEGLSGPPPELAAVVLAGGAERECHGLLVPATMRQRSRLAERLGAEAAEPNPIAADAVQADPTFRTRVPGLFAAGDLTPGMPSVANVVAAGSSAAAMVVHDLVEEAFGAMP